MKSMKQTIGYLRSAWNWGVLGLVLALAVTLWAGEVASAATLRTINLNTGFDQWASPPALIPVSGIDNEWRVVLDQTSSPSEPPGNGVSTGRPANVVIDNSWGAHPSGGPVPYQNSRWISIDLSRQALKPPPTPYQYVFYFTLPPGFSSPQLTMDLNADDYITNVTLNSCSLFTGFGGITGGIFNDPPVHISSTSSQAGCFESGPNVNVLTVTVLDYFGGLTGLIVAGTVTYDDCDRPVVRQIPGLQSITFFESTGATTSIPLAVNISDLVGTTPLTTRISGALGPGPNNDFEGAPGEFYDVFYSDWDGTFNYNGRFVTIEAVWPGGAPSGGGLNIGAVQLNFATGPPQLANFVSSFVALGNNAMPNDVGRAVDISPVTATTMGNTNVPPTQQRLRVTVGFPCCVPPPSGMVAWWPLDEANGATAVNDIAPPPSSIVNNVGTPQPGGAVGSDAPNAVTGQVNGALYFYPYHFVQVPDDPELNFGKFDLTIDAWIKPVQAGMQGIDPIVDKLALPFPLPSPPTGTGYALYIKNQQLHFVMGDGGPLATYISASSPPIQPGTWTHVAVTVARSINAVTLYINGSQVPLQTPVPPLPAGSITNNVPLVIGYSRLQPDAPVEIAIDELEIFNVALPQSDIQSIYNAGPAGKCRTTPDPLLFIDVTGVLRNTVQTSNAVTVSGLTAPAAIAVVGGEYELNSSGTWTSSDGTVGSGDTVRVRHTAAATISTAVHTTLTIGGVSDTFTSTTRGPDLTGVWNPVSQSCLQNKCKLKGSVRVVNQGTATAGASRLRVLLSDDAVLDPSDAVLKESKIKKLKSGHGKTSKVKVTLPLGVTASGKYLFAVIDTLNLVVETDETNNTPMTGPIP